MGSDGVWSWKLLRCGAFRLDAGCMFGLIPRVVWMKWFPEGVIDDQNRMPLQTNSLLLESGGKLVVVEVGIGDKLGPREVGIYAQELTPAGRARTVYDAVEEAGARPEDVSAVIVTHLHFDHAGGLTRLGPSADPEKPVLTFPNAEIIVQSQEWNDAIRNRSTMNKTYLKNHLTGAVRERLRLVKGQQEVFPGVSVFPVPGHTWGQQCVGIDTPDGRTIVFTNDVMPTALHCRPTTNLAYDVEPYTSMIERRHLLDTAAEDKWTLVLDHEPGHAVYGVEHDPEREGMHRLVRA